MDKGKYIVFDGPDQSGKTTTMKIVVDRLNEVHGPNFAVSTREPGGPTAFGAQVRSILLNPDISLDPVAQLLLFMADRRQHVVEFVQKHLDAGVHVFSDRGLYSTIAYQIDSFQALEGTGFTAVDLARLISLPEYNHTFYFSASPGVCLARKLGLRDGEAATTDRFEDYGVELRESVFRSFERQFPVGNSRTFLGEYTRVDAHKRQDIIADFILSRLGPILGL